jgi:hypothetical protein
MPLTVFSGALGPKKKKELSEIARALQISDEGTKEELQARIRKHLDQNPHLEDDTMYAGLYPRRKRSVQPLPVQGYVYLFIPSCHSTFPAVATHCQMRNLMKTTVVLLTPPSLRILALSKSH